MATLSSIPSSVSRVCFSGYDHADPPTSRFLCVNEQKKQRRRSCRVRCVARCCFLTFVLPVSSHVLYERITSAHSMYVRLHDNTCTIFLSDCTKKGHQSHITSKHVVIAVCQTGAQTLAHFFVMKQFLNVRLWHGGKCTCIRLLPVKRKKYMHPPTAC